MRAGLNPTVIVVTALVCTTLLEAIALITGLDGLLLQGVFAMLAGAVGFFLRPLTAKR